MVHTPPISIPFIGSKSKIIYLMNILICLFYATDDGKETKTKHVDLHDLAKLTDENIANLITKGQKQQNNTNATDK